jgi:hypothetical protein
MSCVQGSGLRGDVLRAGLRCCAELAAPGAEPDLGFRVYVNRQVLYATLTSTFR